MVNVFSGNQTIFACVRVGDCKFLDNSYKISEFFDTDLCRLLNLMLIVLFLDAFSSRKTYFLGILSFLCRLYNFRSCLFQCEVSSFSSFYVR